MDAATALLEKEIHEADVAMSLSQEALARDQAAKKHAKAEKIEAEYAEQLAQRRLADVAVLQAKSLGQLTVETVAAAANSLLPR